MTLLECAVEKKSNTAVVRLTQQDLAEMLSTSRQTISAYLKKLVEQGMVETRRGKLVLLDLDSLGNRLV